MAKEFFDELEETIKKTTKIITKRADQVYGMQKLRGNILREERMIEKQYLEIGKIMYKKFEEGAMEDEELQTFCEEIRKHKEIVAGYRKKLSGMKGQRICPSCHNAVDKDAAFCSFCGAPRPEEEPVEESTEKAAEDEMEETAEEDTIIDIEDLTDEPEEPVAEEAEKETEKTAEAAPEETTEETKPEADAEDETV